MANCGSSSTPACLDAQSTTWEINYIIPDPPYIRYQYPNGESGEILGGTDFTIEVVSGDTSSLYTYTLGWKWKTPSGNFDGRTGFWKRANVRGSIGQPIFTPYTPESPINPRVDIPFNNGASITGLAWDGNEHFTVRRTCTGITNFTIVKSNGQPLEDGYKLTIYDCHSNALFSKISTQQPTVIKFPPKFDPAHTKIFTYPPNQPPRTGFHTGIKIEDVSGGAENTLGKKATAIDPTGNAPPVVLLEVYSPQCSPAPQMCWNCQADPPDLCPPNTVCKCLNDEGKICCYGGDGNVIKVVSTKDETPDC